MPARPHLHEQQQHHHPRTVSKTRDSDWTTNATAAPGRCVCPSLAVCTAGGLASALLRLPENVSSAESPWYWYLSNVYRGSLPPPPLRLRDRLQVLYPALLPTPVCLHPPRNSTLPECSAGVCDAW